MTMCVALPQSPDRLVEPGGLLAGDPVETHPLAHAVEGRKLGSGALDDPEPVLAANRPVRPDPAFSVRAENELGRHWPEQPPQVAARHLAQHGRSHVGALGQLLGGPAGPQLLHQVSGCGRVPGDDDLLDGERRLGSVACPVLPVEPAELILGGLNDVPAQDMEHLLHEDIVDPAIGFESHVEGLAHQNLLIDVRILDELPLFGTERSAAYGLQLRDPNGNLHGIDRDDVAAPRLEHRIRGEQHGCQQHEVGRRLAQDALEEGRCRSRFSHARAPSGATGHRGRQWSNGVVKTYCGKDEPDRPQAARAAGRDRAGGIIECAGKTPAP